MSELKNSKGQTYQQWYKQVDQCVDRKTMLSVDDLADMNFLDMFKDDCPAQEAADEALANEGYEEMCDFGW